MDEASLRAMMPTSFGRRPVKKRTAAEVREPSTASVGGSMGKAGEDASGLSSTVLGKRSEEQAHSKGEQEEEEDDGLTAEERAENREAERMARERRAKGLHSDDDDDDDSDSDSDVGPSPPPSHPSVTLSPIPPLSLPPTANTATFNTHTKTLSALAVDPSGSRFALGSYDYNLSLYDFGGLTTTLKPFRLFEPVENYPVLDLDFSPSGSRLLVINGTSEASVYTRDGAEVGKCKSGDPYLRDMRNTKGHVGGLTCGTWGGGGEDGRFFTAGRDSTVRIWDAETMQRGQREVVVLKSKTRGGRTTVTAVHVDGEQLWASGLDGWLGMWDLRGNLNGKPRAGVAAHQEATWTSSIAISAERVVTRGGDGTVKLWDVRKLSSPVAERQGLHSGSVHTSVIWDPFSRRTLLTGMTDTAHRSSTEKVHGEETTGGGKILVLDAHTLSTSETIPLTSSPIRLHWSAETDQLFCTHRNGSLSLFYSPTRSRKGITLAMSRETSSRSSFYTSTSTTSTSSYPISNPDQIVQSESAKRRRLAKERADPLKTRMPQAPIEGRGRGGRIGAGAMQGVVQNIFGVPDDLDIDPREALLKYANKDGDSRTDEYTKAWNKTQPNKIFSQYEEDE